MSHKLCSDGNEAAPYSCEVCIYLVVSYACAVFEHLRIPDPVVAYLAASPVTSDELREVFGIALLVGIFAGVIVGQFGLGVFFSRVGTLNQDECACPWQRRLDRFDGIDVYCAAVDAPEGFLLTRL